jgi:sensor histidine kinase YesM
MAEDLIMTGAALGGVIIALVWRGILPYLMKRKEAEELGQSIPPFGVAYITTFTISLVGGIISVMMVVSELEARLVGVGSIMSAASIGLTFTFTILSGLNTFVDLKTDKIIAAKLGFIKTEDQQMAEKLKKQEERRQQQEEDKKQSS